MNQIINPEWVEAALIWLQAVLFGAAAVVLIAVTFSIIEDWIESKFHDMLRETNGGNEMDNNQPPVDFDPFADSPALRRQAEVIRLPRSKYDYDKKRGQK